ncbi:MAG: PH domain-containing protein [Gemmatimonadota bacterium]|nr:MAG: PH domain-containing protein [Gemmatimonadota bacterium]
MISALLLTVLTGALEARLLAPAGISLVLPGLITACVAAVGFVLALTWPSLRYRHWLWLVERDRVLIHKGVVWRSRSLIPRVRVQHVDTRTSPLQRWLGLSSLIIYTAGTRGADAEIPGLDSDQAESLREQLAHLEDLDEGP